MPTGIYQRKRIPPEIRFLGKVKKTENGCWEWMAYKERRGYGKFVAKGETLAHRFSYLIHKGEIPKEMLVCHSCDNPSCVNPEHLWLGTAMDNTKDCISKGRDRHVIVRGEKNGLSKLTEKDVIKIKKLAILRYGQKEIANLFKCDQTNIHYILSGKTWKHVKA